MTVHHRIVKHVREGDGSIDEPMVLVDGIEDEVHQRFADQCGAHALDEKFLVASGREHDSVNSVVTHAKEGCARSARISLREQYRLPEDDVVKK